MRYILVTTDKHGKCKRHIVKRSHDYFWLKVNAKHIDHKESKVEIYKGNWELVEEV